MKNCLLYFLFFSSAIFGQEITALLPDSAGTWKKSGLPELYIENELFRLIDGGADIFIEYGFKQVITQRYENSGEGFIDVEIYEMKDSSSAFGIFSLFTLNTGYKINFSCEAYAGDEFLLFWKGNFYVGLTAINLPGYAKEELLLLAEKIEPGIYAAGKPAIIDLFAGSDIMKTTYIKGNLGFYNISRINLGKVFQLHEGIHFNTKGVNCYLFRYGNNEECRNNFDKALESFSNSTGYVLQQNEPDLYIYEEGNVLILCRLIRNQIVLLVSENKNNMVEISEEIEDILLIQN